MVSGHLRGGGGAPVVVRMLFSVASLLLAHGAHDHNWRLLVPFIQGLAGIAELKAEISKMTDLESPE